MANEKGPLLSALEEVRKNPTITSQALAARSAKNTRPAPPVEGLETVLWGNTRSLSKPHDPIVWERMCASYPRPYYTVELVTRSQAEAIIAAERKQKDHFADLAERRFEELRELKADNAALTARVKELEGEVFHDPALGITWKQICEQFDKECTHHQERSQTLETQLAAAEKALAWYANPEIYKPHPHGIGFEDRDKSYVAKAALEAKP